MYVIGEMVHKFPFLGEFHNQMSNLTSVYDLIIQLKNGGTRKLKVQVVSVDPTKCHPIQLNGAQFMPQTGGYDIMPEVTATVIDCGPGEKLSGEMYYEIAPGHKKMIPEIKADTDSKSWRVDRGNWNRGLRVITQSIQIIFEDALNVDQEEMQKMSAFVLEADYETSRKNGLMSDVTIVCEGARLPAHKLSLSARSKVFATMFSRKNTLEEQKQEVLVNDLDKPTMETFLKFLYDAALPKDTSFEVYVELLKAADKYQVQSLVDVCAMMLGENINQENAVKNVILGSFYRIPKLKKDAIKAIVSSDTNLSSMEGYEELRGYPDLLIEMLEYCQEGNSGKRNRSMPIKEY